MTDEQKKRKNECAKQNRQWKKERHLCTCCGKQDAYTLVGRSFCYECCEKERKRKRSNQAMSKIYAQRYEKYHKNIALGICPICGKREVTDGHINCQLCRAKKAQREAKYRFNRGVLPRCLLDGVDRCAVCGAENVVEGHKVCMRCLENGRNAIEKANRTPREKDNYFRELNDAFWKSKGACTGGTN